MFMMMMMTKGHKVTWSRGSEADRCKGGE